MAMLKDGGNWWNVVVDNRDPSDQGNGAAPGADLSADNPYGYGADMYDQAGFDNAWANLPESTLSPSTGLADSGYFDYSSAGNPFSYDVNTGDFMGNSMYSSGDLGTGGYTPSSSDVSALYGSSGYGENPPPGNDFLRRYRDAVQPFQGLLKNPIVSTLMSLNPTTALLKTVLGGPNSVGGFLGSLFGNTPIGKLAGAFSGSQLANYATEGKFAPINTGATIGSLAGNLSGMPFGGQVGGFLGNQIGNSLVAGETGGMPNGMGGGFGMVRGATPDYGAGMGNMLPTNNNDGLGALVGLGLGMNSNRVSNNQIKTLEGLFGQNSSYAQAMRQQLERRDAAGGRRSQYGPREVELQAMLAQQAAKLQPGLQQLYSQRTGTQNRMAANLLNALARNPNIGSGIQEAWGGLQNIFDTPSDPFSGGGFQSGTEGMGD